MERKRFGFLLLVLVALSGCTKTAASTISDLLSREGAGKTLLYYQKGNFTNSGKEEYVVFFEDPRKRHDPSSPPMINMVAFFVIDGSKVLERFSLTDVWSAGYNNWALKTIKSAEIGGRAWNGYCFVGDFNGDGRDEVLFFTLGGNIFIARVFEFVNNDFRTVLSYPAGSSLSKIALDEKLKAFRIYDSGGPGVAEGSRTWYEMTWNSESSSYRLSQKGVGQWYDPKTGKILQN